MMGHSGKLQEWTVSSRDPSPPMQMISSASWEYSLVTVYPRSTSFFRQIRLGFQGKLAAVGKYVDKFFLHDLVPCNIYAHTMQVLQQRFEFIQQLIECFHGLLYRKRRTHVHAGDLQKLDRVVGFAGLEKLYIRLSGRFAISQYLI